MGKFACHCDECIAHTTVVAQSRHDGPSFIIHSQWARDWRGARARRGIPRMMGGRVMTRHMHDAPGPNDRANDDTSMTTDGDVDMAADDTRVVSEVKRESGACPWRMWISTRRRRERTTNERLTTNDDVRCVDDQCWICLDGDTAGREVRRRRRDDEPSSIFTTTTDDARQKKTRGAEISLTDVGPLADARAGARSPRDASSAHA